MPVITISFISWRNNESRPGHAFISFNNEANGPESYGFYPSGSPKTLWSPGLTPGEVRSETPSVFWQTPDDVSTISQLHVEVSQAEYDAMLAFAHDEYARNPPGGSLNPREYDFFGRDTDFDAARNCVTWVNEVLGQAGLNADLDILVAKPPQVGLLDFFADAPGMSGRVLDKDAFFPDGTSPHFPTSSDDFILGNSSLSDATAAALNDLKDQVVDQFRALSKALLPTQAAARDAANGFAADANAAAQAGMDALRSWLKGAIDAVGNPFHLPIAARAFRLLAPLPWLSTFLSAEAANPPPLCPLVIDLDGDGTTSLATSAGAYFDHAGDGFAESTGWVGPNDALLVWDRNGNGRIDSGRELFGDQTFLQNGERAADGFAALREWDDNLDGHIDADDAIWSNLQVWTDLDGNGFSTSGELKTLAEAGVTAFYLTSNPGGGSDSNGNTVVLTGTYQNADGEMRQLVDYQFITNTAYSTPESLVDIPTSVASLADAKGYGVVYDLDQAMARDLSGALQDAVSAFANAAHQMTRDALLDSLIYAWAGVESVDPSSRGSNIDARKLAALEKFMGRPFAGTTGGDPHAGGAALLNTAYRQLAESTYAQLMVQTHLKSQFGAISYGWDSTSEAIRGDISAVKFQIEGAIAADHGAGIILAGEFIRAVNGLGIQHTLNLDILRSNPEIGEILDGAHVIGATDVDDVVLGSSGKDFIFGDMGDDVLDGGNGADTLYGGAGDDVLGGAMHSADWNGDDGAFGYAGNVLEGGAGNDTLRGAIGGDTYRFNVGDGQDTIYEDTDGYGAGQVDTLAFGPDITPGDVHMVRSGYSLVFNVGSNGDRVTVANQYHGEQYGIERAEFADGTVWDASTLNAVPNLIEGTNEADTIVGLASASNVIYGLAGDDVIEGDNRPDTLYGGDGDDVLGGAVYSADWGTLNNNGDDYGGNTLEGGAGNDTLRGAIGGDTYRFSLGDGHDTIYEDTTGYGGGQVDKIVFGAGITTVDVRAVRSGSSLIFNVGNNGDRITVTNHYAGEQYGIERAVFADGTVWDATTFSAIPNLIEGTADADTLTGLGSTSNVIYGFAGDDVIEGNNREDTLYGGDGDDVLGGAVYSSDWAADVGVGAYVGNILEGGHGNDTLRGAIGGDTYRFNLGDGQDTIYEDRNGWAAGLDKVVFGAGITPSDVDAARSADSLVLTIGSDGDRITVDGQFAGSLYGIERVEFADGSAWDASTLAAMTSVMHGTAEADSLVGWANIENVIYGLEGDDTLEGNNKADTLYGGAGDDVLGGTVWTADWLASDAGGYVGNILEGGAGNDTLRGAIGGDTYRFNLGDGHDTIYEDTGDYGSAIDTVAFGADIAPDDVEAMRSGPALVLKVGGNGDRITVSNQYGGPRYGIEQVQFVDGTVWDASAFTTLPSVVEGTAQADSLLGSANLTNVIYGFDGDDTLEGNNKADTIYGGAGNDVLGGTVWTADWLASDESGYVGNILEGGTGNDTLRGAIGGDTYRFNVGDGQDTIYEDTGGYGSATDTVVFGSDVAPNDVQAMRSGNSLILNVGSNGDRITVSNHYAGIQNGIEQVQFADGTTWNATAFANLPSIMNGTADADSLVGLANVSNAIYGLDGDDVIEGNNKADTLNGGAGDDVLGGNVWTADWLASDGGDYVGNTLEGGAGNDTLRGAIGGDTYRFNMGDGQDTIYEDTGDYGSAIDTVAFGADVTPADVQAMRSGNSLILNVGSNGDRITVSNHYAGIRNGIEQVQFADGTTWDASAFDSAPNLITGTAADDTLTGSADLSNVIYGSGGDDSVQGGNSGDYLAGGAGNDSVAAGDGTDVAQGESGDDVLAGGGGNDLLAGDAGADSLAGGSGNDFLAGGAGNDSIDTGGGSNIVAFNRGDGSDAVSSDAGATNALSLGGGIGYDQLSLSKSGDDLVLDAGDGDQIWMKDWYAGKDNLLDLQIVLDATTAFDAASSDPLYNRRVQHFDFHTMVAEFDQARAESPGLTSWAITNALLESHLSGTDDAALGGDVAYWFGKNGGLTGMSFQAAQAVVGAPGFGADAQTLRPFSGLQDGFVKLS